MDQSVTFLTTGFPLNPFKWSLAMTVPSPLFHTWLSAVAGLLQWSVCPVISVSVTAFLWLAPLKPYIVVTSLSTLLLWICLRLQCPLFLLAFPSTWFFPLLLLFSKWLTSPEYGYLPSGVGRKSSLLGSQHLEKGEMRRKSTFASVLTFCLEIWGANHLA